MFGKTLIFLKDKFVKILKIVIFVLIFIFGLTGHILLARDLSIIPDSVSIILGRPTDQLDNTKYPFSKKHGDLFQIWPKFR